MILGSEPLFYGYSIHSRCFLFVAVLRTKNTSKVWSFPLSEAGLDPKLCPV